MPDIKQMFERRTIALIIKDTMKQHDAKDNMGGGWDCTTCGIRWDWTDKKRATEHAPLLAADAILSRTSSSDVTP